MFDYLEKKTQLNIALKEIAKNKFVIFQIGRALK